MHMSFNDELQKTSLILRGGDVVVVGCMGCQNVG
jgi:hypothetical protein